MGVLRTRCDPLIRFGYVAAVIDSMQFDILPYVLFMVVPVLGRMSDSDESMRLLATQTFATLVKLVPLEVSLSSSYPDYVG
jgi:hypothetical protein